MDWETHRGELGALIVGEESGKGYPSETADLCLTNAFDELGCDKGWATVQGNHKAPKRVLEYRDLTEDSVLWDRHYAYGYYFATYRFGLLDSEGYALCIQQANVETCRVGR